MVVSSLSAKSLFFFADLMLSLTLFIKRPTIETMRGLVRCSDIYSWLYLNLAKVAVVYLFE